MNNKERNQAYIDFAIKIMGIIDETELSNTIIMNKVKLYYARVTTEELVAIVDDYCEDNQVEYIVANDKKTITFYKTDTQEMIFKKIVKEELIDSLVISILQVYDKIA